MPRKITVKTTDNETDNQIVEETQPDAANTYTGQRISRTEALISYVEECEGLLSTENKLLEDYNQARQTNNNPNDIDIRAYELARLFNLRRFATSHIVGLLVRMSQYREALAAELAFKHGQTR